MKTLRGITWDHPRGIDPLRAASDQYTLTTGTAVSWSARPLASFEDVPADVLARDYDLLAIDHPSIGDAKRAGALLPLDDLVDSETLLARAADSAGPSHQSYQWEGQQWALGIDAACMVSAVRGDLIDPGSLPTDWRDVPRFVTSLGRERVLMPANPTHLYCTLLTLIEALSGDAARQPDGRPAWWTDEGFDPDALHPALELLRELVAACNPDSHTSNPITVLDRLVDPEGGIAYVPLVFQYVTYSLERRGRARATFVNPPGVRGSLTGGVGLAVSAFSDDPEAAAHFAAYASSTATQVGVFARSGGQPVSRTAWQDPSTNRLSLDFFSGTLATMDSAFLRPRFVGYPSFQSAAGEILHALMAGGASAATISRELAALWGDRVEH
ncbi:extracellular solute-binding protein [soil metagenome]